MFAQIATESRQVVQDQFAHRFDNTTNTDSDDANRAPSQRTTIPRSFPTSNARARTPEDPGWDPAADRERRAEIAREDEMRGGEMGGEPQFPAGQRRGMNEAKSAWERLRNVSPIRGRTGQGGGGGGEAEMAEVAAEEGERAREQREFDEMLERERMGVGEKDWK